MITIFPKAHRDSNGNSTIFDDTYYLASSNPSGDLERNLASDPMRVDSRSHQWIKTEAVLPPAATPVLYLGAAADTAATIVHCGHYEPRRQAFIEQGSGATLPQEAVIAWMWIPTLPVKRYQEGGFTRPCRSSMPPVALNSATSAE